MPLASAMLLEWLWCVFLELVTLLCSAPGPPQKRRFGFWVAWIRRIIHSEHFLVLHIGVGISDSVNQLPLLEYFSEMKGL